MQLREFDRADLADRGEIYLSGAEANDTPETNDGKVNRARWGYLQADGSGPGSVLGTTVTRRP